MHRSKLHHQNIPHQPAKLLQERGRILPFHPEAVKQRNCRCSVMRADFIKQLQRPPVSCKADGCINLVHSDFSVGRTLIQHAERIAHTAFSKACEKRGCIGRQVKLLLLSNLQQIIPQFLCLNSPEAVPLAAGKNRGGNFLQLRRSQDKKQVLWRLLQDLQKGIESAGREHMNFVNNINAFFHHGG